MKRIYLLLALLTLGASSCSVVKPYQRQYVNDYTMSQSPLSVEKAESEGFTYREGASGGEGGKIGGGCGCN
ncbi:DUF4266 domain-containing protein [Arcicella sp. LKC2W]|uniref:DUF4266 domain-containing protein n=1 Tax=Arcicella sp. LKC2W TaxID=2984198 RepID=UPI002B1EFD89|nr:DUF4266 domain-containing protein [Arcicella sp. LKC2W]MEA5461865.1 DUF4266 domain-containing protein [Arcicella sp. LKC2W]